ncbi:hypothetical protein BDN67DRAFT_985205 [Paxillus ammoniavirescens]|nr:hypothetical protein BDN67DRAFT_985205 [Paxillus ammoniavirescens]
MVPQQWARQVSQRLLVGGVIGIAMRGRAWHACIRLLLLLWLEIKVDMCGGNGMHYSLSAYHFRSRYVWYTSSFCGMPCCRLSGQDAEFSAGWMDLHEAYLMFHEPPASSSSALDLEIEEEENIVAAELTSTEDLDWILDLSDDSDVEA